MKTMTQELIEAGWQKSSRSHGECGEALHASGAGLNGLACQKSATWLPGDAPDGEPWRCAQHAVRLARQRPPVPASL